MSRAPITQQTTWLYFDTSCQTVTMLFNKYHSHRCAKTTSDIWSDLIHHPEMTDCKELKTMLRY